MIELCEIGKKVRIFSIRAAVIDSNNTQDKKPFGLGRYDVLYHVGLFRMSQFCLAYSLASILGGMHISSVWFQFRC